MTPNKIDFGIDELNQAIQDIASWQATQKASEFKSAQSAASSIASESKQMPKLAAAERPRYRDMADRSSERYRDAALSQNDKLAADQYERMTPDQLDEEHYRDHYRDRSFYRREDPDMASQLANLETQVGDIRVGMGKVETKLEYIEKNMLTKGRAAIIALGVVLGVFAGGWWVVQQYLSPILAATGANG